MTALRHYGVHETKLCKSVFRLSTGKKLASDDPAGAMIAAKLQARIRELGVIIRKTEEKQDMLNIAFGDTMGRQNILQRMRELTLGMANDTFSQAEKDILAVEFEELAKEFGVKTFEKTGLEIVALETGDSISDLVFKKDDMLFIDGEWKKLSELEKAQEMKGEKTPLKTTTLTDYVDSMMKQNIFAASSISAFSSALSFRLERLQAEEGNAIAALSRVEDIDIADEIMEFIKEKMLAQTSLAVAAQANALPEQVLKLLETLPIAK